MICLWVQMDEPRAELVSHVSTDLMFDTINNAEVFAAIKKKVTNRVSSERCLPQPSPKMARVFSWLPAVERQRKLNLVYSTATDGFRSLQFLNRIVRIIHTDIFPIFCLARMNHQTLSLLSQFFVWESDLGLIGSHFFFEKSHHCFLVRQQRPSISLFFVNS